MCPRFKTTFTLLWLLLLGLHAAAQPKAIQLEAQQLAKEGRALVGEGEFDKAILKFSQATKLVPKNIGYRIGLAEAWFFAEDYVKAMDICRPLMEGRSATPQAFQVYGNCLDGLGQTYEALATYRLGLQRFPTAGILYQEMGLVEAGRAHLDAAMEYWEAGIAAQPGLPSNYYFAAQQLYEIGDYAWAANYAEIYIVLARSGEQVREMSKLLMASYEKARTYDYEKGYVWRFWQAEPLTDTAQGVPDYHRLLDGAFAAQTVDTTDQLDIAALIALRRFVCLLLPSQVPKHASAQLYDWQQRLIKAGHFEAYHYWLLYDARQADFMAWLDDKQQEFDAFEEWMLRNTLYISPKRPILRTNTEAQGKK